MLVLAPFRVGETLSVALLAILPKLQRKERTLYLVPTKALVGDVVRSLNRIFGGRVKVRELLTDEISAPDVEDASVLVTIPEELNILMQRSVFVTLSVKLVVIDCVHLLHDEQRGHTLEAIITRIVRQNQRLDEKESVRLVGLSYTFSQCEELALFLGVDIEQGLFYFDNSFRTSSLSTQYLGVWKDINKSLFTYLNCICHERVTTAGANQVIIFVSSSKDTTNTALAIKKFGLNTAGNGDSVPIGNVRNHVLKKLLPCGLAIHHLGLDKNDQEQVLDLFQKRHIRVLVCTRTLAWSLNLHAHTVIVKGTLANESLNELSFIHIMQMWSHADKEFILITGELELRRYTCMLNENFPIQSRIDSRLADHLNTEICLGSVRDTAEALDWFRNTYLYFCFIRNPSLYGVRADEFCQDITLKKRCEDLILAAITILATYKLVVFYDRRYLNISQLGRISCYYSVCHGTIVKCLVFESSTGNMDLEKLFLDSDEFKPIRMELDENKELENKLLCDLSSATGILGKELTAKINIFLQKLEELSDLVYIQQSAGRLLQALLQSFFHRGSFKLALNTLNLCKKPIDQLPKLTFSAHFKPTRNLLLRVELTLRPNFSWNDNVHGYVEPFWVIMEMNNQIIYREYFLLKKEYHNRNHPLHFIVPFVSPYKYHICVVSDRWIGSQVDRQFDLGQFCLPVPSPPSTLLLRLPLISVDAFKHRLHRKLYEGHVTQFNVIQAQVFKALYESNDNVLVAAPSGSGKTFCAEFAILRNHVEDRPGMKVVYIAASEAIAKKRFRDWEVKFKLSELNLEVLKLTGETAKDLRLLESGQIIISTPEKWDALSRRWKQRKGVRDLSLFIVDDLHLIGEQGGSILEAIVSRMRCIKFESRMRIVALSNSVDDAEDMGLWILAGERARFNFSSHVRQVPVNIFLEEVDLPNVEVGISGAKLASLTCTAVLQHGRNGRPCLVYVPTDTHVQPAVLNLVTFVSAGSSRKHSPSLQPYIGKVKNRILKQTLLYGVGFLHEGLTSGDQQVVVQLFEAEKIQICVMSSSMCWVMALSAHLVVVMGTRYHDEHKRLNVDYSASDLLEMVGHARCPEKDGPAKCVFLCHSPSRPYYEDFLNEKRPNVLSVESQLLPYLHDILNAEVVSGQITCKDSAVNFVADTYFVQRATKNPSYYSMDCDGKEEALFIQISSLVEDTLMDLIERKFIQNLTDTALSPLSLGEIASDNCISYSTSEVFRSSLTPETNMMGLLQILAFASEYSQLPVRPEEKEVVQPLLKLQKYPWGENPESTYTHIKAFVLLQAHFSRQLVDGNVALAQQEVLVLASRLLPVMVDVIAVNFGNGGLDLVLLAMEVNQMVTQGLWNCDSELLQIPHFTQELAEKCKRYPGKSIETVDDLLEMKEDERCELLMLSNEQMLDIVRVCKRFPKFTIKVRVLNSKTLGENRRITLSVHLERHLEESTDVGPVYAPRYPYAKEERWWVVLGDPKINSLLAVERVSQQSSKIHLEFLVSAKDGQKTYTIYHVCDAYVRCKQEFSITV